MDLLKIFIVILHIFILINSYKLICRATKKERFLFICWIFILQSVVEIFFYFVFLHGLGLEKFMFPFIIYVYLIGVKKYNKYKAIFISLLFYSSNHILYNRWFFCNKIWSSLFCSSFIADLFCNKRNYYLFSPWTSLFWQRLPLSIFKKSYTWFLYFTYSIIHFRYGKYSCTF